MLFWPAPTHLYIFPKRQFWGTFKREVHKSFNTWLCQGIIHESNSSYVSQVVIVHKKIWGDLSLCRLLEIPSSPGMHFLWHSSDVFTSFDLAQWYLQLAMTEEDIKKTAFRAGSSGLYKYTHMPFGLSNAGSSFCRLMEQCLCDQQLVTLLCI